MSPRRFRVWLSLAAFVAGVSACEINPQPPLPAGGKGPATPGVGGTVMDGATAGTSSGGSLAIDFGGTGSATAGTAATAGAAPIETPADGGAPGAGGAGGDNGQDGGAGGQDGGAGGTPPK